MNIAIVWNRRVNIATVWNKTGLNKQIFEEWLINYLMRMYFHILFLRDLSGWPFWFIWKKTNILIIFLDESFFVWYQTTGLSRFKIGICMYTLKHIFFIHCDHHKAWIHCYFYFYDCGRLNMNGCLLTNFCEIISTDFPAFCYVFEEINNILE